MIAIVNRVFKKLQGYGVSYDSFALHPMSGSVEVLGVVLHKKLTRERARPFASIRKISVSVRWASLLMGRFIADVVMDEPNVELDMAVWRQPVTPRPSPERRKRLDFTWQQTLKKAIPFRINRVEIRNGEVRLRNLPGQGTDKLRMTDIALQIRNMTNSEHMSSTLMATAEATARVMSSGVLNCRAKIRPLEEKPTFEAELQVTDVNMGEFKNLFRHSLGANVHEGLLDVFGEMVSAQGVVKGYVKPIMDHLKIEPLNNEGIAAKSKAVVAKAVAKILRNPEADRIATKINFEGSFNNPDVKLWDAIGNFLKNAFQVAFARKLDHEIHLTPGALSELVEISYPPTPEKKKHPYLHLLKETYTHWSEDQCPRMAAALSYYTSFSLAPLLILIIAVAGLAFGREATQGRLLDELSGLMGPDSAKAIQSMIATAWQPAKGILAGSISVVGLLAGASGVLSELKQALNRIWRTEETGDLSTIVTERAKYFAMILGIGFLMLVSLAISAGLAALGKFVGGVLPLPEAVLHMVNLFFSFIVIAVLFALIFKYLPNAEVEWSDVRIGAAGTAILFTAGKFALGLYLGKSAVASSYGAAGSVLIILMWVYYSALILYFGAEFTCVYSKRFGSPPKTLQKTATAA